DDMLTMGRPNKPPRPWLGLYATEIEDKVVVAGLATKGPAQKANLHTGDILLAGGRTRGKQPPRPFCPHLGPGHPRRGSADDGVPRRPHLRGARVLVRPWPLPQRPQPALTEFIRVVMAAPGHFVPGVTRPSTYLFELWRGCPAQGCSRPSVTTLFNY